MTPGTRLGPYEIISLLGKGGMGEVYKARDPRLNREIALKVSKAEFTERFKQEATLVAQLNHPNICTLHDVGPNYFVMELIDGVPLKGPLPVEKAVEYARQILDALDAAHRKSITHRDLKPANILVTKQGIKLLDFGLAKQAPGLGPDDVTIQAMTAEGQISGTLQYMSPEQLQGKKADARSDIFSFGCVLYEMLSGARAFGGTNAASIIAAIMEREPEPLKTTPPLDRTIRTCLAKDPDRRFQNALDLERNLMWAMEPEGATAAPSRSRFGMAGWIAAVVFALTAVGVSLVHFREKPPAAYPMRFQIPPPDKGSFGAYVVISPDGHKLAFNTTGPEGGLWVRDLNSLELRLLPGTQNAVSPFWSPDSRFLAFGAGDQLKKVDASGGAPQTLCESPSAVGSGAWNREGVIIFGGRGRGPIRRVPEAGGVATEVTAVDASRQEGNHILPTFLPDGRHFVYFRRGAAENTGIFLGSLDAKPAAQSRDRLLATQFGVVWAPSAAGAGGHLFFLRDGTLMAQPFDAGQLKLAGEPVPVAEHVGTLGLNGFFSVSANGALAYRTGESASDRQLAWFDRQGKQSGTAFDPGPYLDLSLSPDGTRAAILRGTGNGSDIWLHDFARGVSTRFTFDVNAGEPDLGKGPVWSPDGTRLVFSSRRAGIFYLFEKTSSGAGNEALLVHSDNSKSPDDWSRDGRFLLYTEAKTSYDLMVLPLEGNDRKPVPLLNTTFAEGQGSFSPDTRWFAYASNESGRHEVYVQPFTPPGSGAAPAVGKWQISRDGGSRPKWRADGKELIFRAPNGSPMAVDITTSPAFQAGIPKPLFTMSPNAGNWDVTADGKRLLAVMPLQGQQNANTPITWC